MRTGWRRQQKCGPWCSMKNTGGAGIWRDKIDGRGMKLKQQTPLTRKKGKTMKFEKATRGIKLVGCAVPMEVAEAIREAAHQDKLPMSDLMRQALEFELKKRGFLKELHA